MVIKFFLNVSRDEQERRFRDRIDDESANRKFSLADVRESEHRDEYMDAYSDMLTFTSTPYEPWYVIPADHKWFMWWAVAGITCERMGSLDIRYPELTPEKQRDLKEAIREIDNKLSAKQQKKHK